MSLNLFVCLLNLNPSLKHWKISSVPGSLRLYLERLRNLDQRCWWVRSQVLRICHLFWFPGLFLAKDHLFLKVLVLYIIQEVSHRSLLSSRSILVSLSLLIFQKFQNCIFHIILNRMLLPMMDCPPKHRKSRSIPGIHRSNGFAKFLKLMYLLSCILVFRLWS